MGLVLYVRRCLTHENVMSIIKSSYMMLYTGMSKYSIQFGSNPNIIIMRQTRVPTVPIKRGENAIHEKKELPADKGF